MSHSTLWRMPLITAGALALVPAAGAQEGRFEFSSETGFERADPYIGEDELAPGGVAELVTGFDTNNWFRWVQPVGGQRVWRFEQQGRMRIHSDRDDLDSILLTPRIQYWTPVGEGWQFRGSGAASWLQRDGDTHYTRLETEGQLRHQPTGLGATVLRLRLTSYDFGDQVVAGLDQTQWRAGIERHWYSQDRREGVRLDAYYKQAEADADRFSHTEWLLRATAWTPLRDGYTLTGRIEFADRTYEDDFSVALPFAREDTRWEAVIGGETPFSDTITLYGEAGYADNDSNIPTRAYSGGIFRIGLRIRS